MSVERGIGPEFEAGFSHVQPALDPHPEDVGPERLLGLASESDTRRPRPWRAPRRRDATGRGCAVVPVVA